MRILITGANGFIAREVIIRLVKSHHEIVACVHNKLLESVPHSSSFKVDFTKSTNSEYWLPYLKGIDVVINCVGVFQTVKEKTMWDIHYETPKALFNACVESGIKKIIHISALGVDQVDVPYATSKLAIENHIQSLDIPSTIIRPGMVYGVGSYGGTSLFRGLVGLPFILPLPGQGKQLQQPIHIEDLSLIIEKSLALPGKQILCAVGSEKLSVRNMLVKLRHWLGFKKAYVIPIPDILIRFASKIGNLIPNSPLSETGVKMMSVDNTATDSQERNLHTLTKIKPRGFSEGLSGMISNVQDRWHARLYFLRPILRLSLAFIWIFSGIISLLPGVLPTSYALLEQAKIPTSMQAISLYLFSGIDILLGLLTLLNFRLPLVGAVQSFLIIFYTTLISFLMPEYWLHPFSAIAKNIPLLVGTLIMMALASER